jgi:hypothetical protein
MDDSDLSGDELKVVRYRILFTKPDLEALFREETRLVDYATTGASLGGLKVARFFEDVANHKVERPTRWRENGYPDGNNFPADPTLPSAMMERNWRFPKEDERYIEFQYEVIRREPKQDSV